MYYYDLVDWNCYPAEWCELDWENYCNSIIPPPLLRIVREGTIGDCPQCYSTTIKRFIWFGKSKGCINPQCKNYYKKV